MQQRAESGHRGGPGQQYLSHQLRPRHRAGGMYLEEQREGCRQGEGIRR